jgi:uncharacterized protein (TIGR02996 family)/excisionase family DNA binding protein
MQGGFDMTPTGETELLRAIEARPDDDALRRVYADWLDDHGRHERAELIRVQLDLADAPPCDHAADPSCPVCTARRRERELLSAHGQEWLDAELPGLGFTLRPSAGWMRPGEWRTGRRLAAFRRGLVGAVFLSLADFLRDAPRLHGVLRFGGRVQLPDRHPLHSGGRYSYGWCQDQNGGLSSDLPSGLFLLAAVRPGSPHEPLTWASEEEALEALSSACRAYVESSHPVLGNRKVFTTGQVAQLLDVSPTTVATWFDLGRLRGYRIPGSQDRRIPRDILVRFMSENGLSALSPAQRAENFLERQRQREERLRRRDSFGMGEVALLVHVSPRTVRHWFDAGRLGGSRGGGGRRRVSRAELLRFLNEHGMPVPACLAEAGQGQPQ